MSDNLKNIQRKINLATNALEKIDLQNQLAWELRLTDIKESLANAIITYNSSLEASYIKGKAESLRVQANAFYVLSKYDQSFHKAIEALELFRELNDKSGEAAIITMLGINSYSLGDYENSLKYHILSCQIREEINDIPGIIISLTNIGTIYFIKKDYAHAAQHFEKGLELARSIGGRPADEAILLINLGSIHSHNKEHEKALQFYFESINRYNFLNNVAVLLSISESFLNIGDLTNAEKYYLLGLDKAISLESNFGEAKARLGLGKVAYKRGEHKLAVQYLEQSITKAGFSSEENILAEAYLSLSEVWASNKDYEKALSYHKLFCTEKEKEFSREADKKTQSLLVLHQVETLKKESESQRALNDELKKLNEEVEKTNRSIVESINYAKHIQDSILPHAGSLKQYFSESFVFQRPKDIISGDFFWIYEKENDILVAAVDCTGHGVSGALMSVVANSVLNQVAVNQWMPNPSFILNEANHFMERTLKAHDDSGLRDSMDIAMCSINKSKTELLFAGAHNPLYHISAGVLTEYKGDSISIGNSASAKFTNHRIKLKKGDCIYTFTDGFADQKGGPLRKKFYYEPFKNLLLKIHLESMEKQKWLLHETINEWMGNEKQIDDMLVIGIKI
ncbi:MAG: tetratricopeptide repeat protein [Bacteroidia bacterium]|nr:tetratricopeptide repeat protein [Bacteroidia bacterium]